MRLKLDPIIEGDPARKEGFRVSEVGGGRKSQGIHLASKGNSLFILHRRTNGVGFVQVVKMEEEQSSESDGYYTPEEEPVCTKPEGSVAKTEVSIMEGTIYHVIAELMKAQPHSVQIVPRLALG